jgi:hypothetical protein
VTTEEESIAEQHLADINKTLRTVTGLALDGARGVRALARGYRGTTLSNEEMSEKLDAIRALVNESVARMEPVSWVAALTEILDGGSSGQA